MVLPWSRRHRPERGAWLKALVALGAGWSAVSPDASAAQSRGCPASLPLPRVREAPDSAPDSAARGSAYWRWTHAFERSNRGVGMLEPASGADGGPPGHDWLPEISLPLYPRPGDSAPSLWMHRGWWVPGPAGRADIRPVTYRGMMETSYEGAALVVTAARADGWIQLYIDIGPIARAASDGLLWTHICLLDLGPTALELRTWEEIFQGPHAPPLSFLSGGPHPLRSGPRDDASVLARLGEDDELVILEFQGDWARVRALIPGVFFTGCLGEDWRGRTVRGWIRWRDAARGTLIWYPTRGC